MDLDGAVKVIEKRAPAVLVGCEFTHAGWDWPPSGATFFSLGFAASVGEGESMRRNVVYTKTRDWWISGKDLDKFIESGCSKLNAFFERKKREG